MTGGEALRAEGCAGRAWGPPASSAKRATWRLLCAAAIALPLSAPTSARAGGFLIYEQSASAVGQGGAFVARADDASAIFYNPAGLAAHPRRSVLLGTTVIMSSTSATLPPPAASADAEFQFNTPPVLYGSWPVSERVVLGLGLFTQYGLSMQWPSDWARRHLVRSAHARSITVNPTVAVKVLPRLFVGAGIDVVYAGFELRRALNLVQAEGDAHLGGTALAFGANVGVLWRAIPDRLDVGFAYRSATNLHVKGDADFTAPPEWDAKLADQPVEARVNTPHLFALAGSVRALPSLQLSLDLVYATWSRFETLAFEFPNDPSLDSSDREDWNDTFGVRLGGEWEVSPAWRLRGGLGFETSPVPEETLSPLIPDADRFGVSVGGAWDRGPFRAELSYMLALFAARDSRLPGYPGHYESTGHIVGAAVQYRR